MMADFVDESPEEGAERHDFAESCRIHPDKDSSPRGRVTGRAVFVKTVKLRSPAGGATLEDLDADRRNTEILTDGVHQSLGVAGDRRPVAGGKTFLEPFRPSTELLRKGQREIEDRVACLVDPTAACVEPVVVGEHHGR